MNEPRFRTKTGHIQVSADALRIERTGARGAAAQRLQGDSKRRTLVVYGFVVAVLGWQGWTALQDGAWPFTAFAWGFATWVVLFLAKARNFSMTPVVPRDATSRVQPVRGWPGLTRDRLVVHFVEDGKPARRYILMPGVLQQGRGEIDRACEVLRAARWPVV
jgi:hypothetical protein